MFFVVFLLFSSFINVLSHSRSCPNGNASCINPELDENNFAKYKPPPTVTPPPRACPYFSLTGLASGHGQYPLLGPYERTKTDNAKKPVYKQMNGPNYLFALNPSLWVIGKTVGEDSGGIVVWDGAEDPQEIKAAWQALDHGKWSFASDLALSCYDFYFELQESILANKEKKKKAEKPALSKERQIEVKSCKRFTITGLFLGESNFERIGEFEYQPDIKHTLCNVWKQVEGSNYFFCIWKDDKLGWLVGERPGADDAGLVVWDPALNPGDIKSTWMVFNSTQWVDRTDVVVTCLDGERVQTPTPTLTPFDIDCKNLMVTGFEYGDSHEYMTGKFVKLPDFIHNRVAYQQTDGDLFFFSIHKGKGWGIGFKLGVEDVGLLVHDASPDPTKITHAWEYWNGNRWVSDERLKCWCADDVQN